MQKTAARDAKKHSLLAVTGVCAAAALALAGCHGTKSAGQAAATAPSGQGSVTAAGCNGDYCPPADWDTAQASTPLPQIAPFSEPLNVVISAKSTVSLSQLQQALGQWKTVSTTTTVSVSGIHVRCISSEQANVTGSGDAPQTVAWRLSGCVGGNDLSLTGNEDHVRIWNQPVPGSKFGAWFIAASYETMCLVKNGQLQTAKSDEAYAVLHPSAAYHCVDGGPGSITTAHTDGYNDAAQDFTAAIVAAAESKGWHVNQRTVAVNRGASAGEGGVPFSPSVNVLTLTS
jgi:hypothetical protein